VKTFAVAVLSAMLATSLTQVASASAAVVYSYEAQPSLTSARPHRTSKPRAPNAPPLGSVMPTSQSEETGGIPSATGDQLVENGLSSPLCGGATREVLSRVAQSNCETSSFVGASAPTNNYELDVHIDTGAFGPSKGGLLSVIQDLFVVPVWNAIVWGVHVLVVMIEWCYALELFSGSTMSEVAHSLQQAQVGFTEPWLVLVLAVASTLALYNGLVRRRIAETLGQALLTLAMMVAGLWVIADPPGTVGAIGRWANQASLGTFGTVAQGTSGNAPRTLGDGLRAVFSGAIETPWCYLEFGNVRWCSDPALLEPRVRKAALALLAGKHASASTPAIRHREELLQEANTNGELFLAFPANGPERNSVKETGSLLHVICQAEDDTKCTGAAAAEAEFRSDGGTVPRMIGLMVIAIGALGMALLLGLVTMRLLAAAALGLLMLLLAPFAVLAPALGDGGRALFGGWAIRLLGAVTSKLTFSFVLGALLTAQHILMTLPLGWWTQWLLVSGFWWGAFLKRHQAAELLRNRGRKPATPVRQAVAQQEQAPQAPRAILRTVHWARGRLPSPASPGERLSKAGLPGAEQCGEEPIASAGGVRA
jgi:hypothetical protein